MLEKDAEIIGKLYLPADVASNITVKIVMDALKEQNFIIPKYKNEMLPWALWKASS